MEINDEKWKDIKGYETNYQVSTLGRVKTKTRTIESAYRGFYKILPSRIIKPQLCKTGYYRIPLTIDKVRKNFRAHRLVAINFIDNPHSKREVNHKDGNKHNNCVENLEWCTPSENMIHAYNSGLLKLGKCDKHPGSKVTREMSEKIRHEYKTGLINRYQLAIKYSVSQSVIARIINGKHWTTK